MTVRVGVIGCGMIGTDHVRTLSAAVSGAQVVAVSDADPDRAGHAAEIAGRAQVRPDAHTLIVDPDVDAVLVASWEATHEEFVLACLAAGKPVLCEKPLATTPDACLRVVEAEAALGRRLVTVGFMRRFDPSYTELKRILTSGQIGEALFLHSIHRNADYPERFESEALVTATGVHDIDITRWLLGQEITAVTAHTPRASSRVRAGFQDPQFLVLETEAGAIVDLEIFVNARYGYDVSCELVGECGTVSLVPPTTALVRFDGVDGHAVPADARPRFAQAFRREMQAWVDAVAGEGVQAVGASAWDGYAAAVVADACLQAGTDGTTKVKLIDQPSLYRTQVEELA